MGHIHLQNLLLFLLKPPPPDSCFILEGPRDRHGYSIMQVGLGQARPWEASSVPSLLTLEDLVEQEAEFHQVTQAFLIFLCVSPSVTVFTVGLFSLILGAILIHITVSQGSVRVHVYAMLKASNEIDTW